MSDAGVYFKRIDEQLSRSANRGLRSAGITLSQLEVLTVLSEAGSVGMSLRQVEARLDVSQPTVAGLVRRLEDKGFVTVAIDEHDRRYRRVRITNRGRQVMHEADDQKQFHENLMLAGFSDKEKSQLMDYLARISANLKTAHLN